LGGPRHHGSFQLGSHQENGAVFGVNLRDINGVLTAPTKQRHEIIVA
jgi:hypothetical protein